MFDIVKSMDFVLPFCWYKDFYTLHLTAYYILYILTPYIVDHKSMFSPIVHAEESCSIITVKTADCAAPTKHIHVVSES